MIEPTIEDQIVSACRTTVGDGLRTVVLFTADDQEMLYVRSDLEAFGEQVRTVKERFVESERAGFEDRETYNRGLVDPDPEPNLGEYEFTIRVFTGGFLSRVIVDDLGVLLTTDDLDVTAFEDMVVALRGLLAEA